MIDRVRRVCPAASAEVLGVFVGVSFALECGSLIEAIDEGELVAMLDDVAEVVDTFGGRATIDPAALVDRARAPGRPRVFRLFELHGDAEAGRAPWLYVPAVFASTLEGDALERVELARDEGANLCWAVERLVEGPLGRAVDRARA